MYGKTFSKGTRNWKKINICPFSKKLSLQHLRWVTKILMLRKGNQRIATTHSSEKKLNRQILFKKYRATFILTATIWSKYLSCHTLSLSNRMLKPFSTNSILYTNTKLYKIGFRTNDLCTVTTNPNH